MDKSPLGEHVPNIGTVSKQHDEGGGVDAEGQWDGFAPIDLLDPTLVLAIQLARHLDGEPDIKDT